MSGRRRPARSSRRLFVLTASMVLAVNAVAGLVGFFWLTRYGFAESIANNRALLAQTRLVVEESLGAVERSAHGLALNTNVNRYLILPQQQSDAYPLWSTLVNTFNYELFTSDKLHSIYLYPLDNRRKVLSDAGVVDRGNFADIGFVQPLVGHNQALWSAVRPYVSYFSVPQGPVQVISLVQPVPGTTGPVRGYLVLNVRAAWFARIAAGVVNDADHFVVVDRAGRVLASNRGEIVGAPYDGEVLAALAPGTTVGLAAHGGGSAAVGAAAAGSAGGRELSVQTAAGRRVVVYAVSERLGWRYLMLMDPAGVAANPLLLNAFFAVVLGAAVIGVLAALGISLRFLRPWVRLVDALAADGVTGTGATADAAPGDEFGIVDASFHRLVAQKDEYAARLAHARSLSRQALLVSLLDNLPYNPDSLHQHLSAIGETIPETGPFSVVLMTTFDTCFGEIDAQVQAIVAQGGTRACRSVPYGAQHLAVVVWPAVSQDWWRALPAALAGATGDPTDEQRVSVIICPDAARLSDLGMAFHGAKQALSFEKLIPPGTVATTDQLFNRIGDERVLLDFERRIVGIGNQLRAANVDAVRSETHAVVTRVFSVPAVNHPQKLALCYDLIRTVNLTLLQLNVSLDEAFGRKVLPFAEFEALAGFDEILPWFDTLVVTAAGYVADRRSVRSEEFVACLMDWVRDNARGDLYTLTAAQHFRWSEAYFCKVVRDCTGKTFGEIVAETRVALAVQELESTDASVEEIAQRAGFGSHRNLLRAFSRIRNETPSDFRRRMARNREYRT